MRKEEFTRWLGGQPVNADTAAMRVRAVSRIERTYGIDLDAAYTSDGLKTLLASFAYSTEDARHSRPNPTRMNINSGDIGSQVRWYRTQLNSYRKFCAAFPPGVKQPDQVSHAPLDEDSPTPQDDFTFALEADLETALRAELDQLEPGLTLADGGQQRKVASGFIDILAHSTDGTHVVIELKAGRTRPEAIAQILGYMADIAEEEGTPVRGYLIGAEHQERVTAAARAIPNLALRRYSYRFRFDN